MDEPQLSKQDPDLVKVQADTAQPKVPTDAPTGITQIGTAGKRHVEQQLLAAALLLIGLVIAIALILSLSLPTNDTSGFTLDRTWSYAK